MDSPLHEIWSLNLTLRIYQYDALGQMVSRRKYWRDGTPLAGQQFNSTFDFIGNRKTAASGAK